jgi:hypothetical protein
MRDLGAELARIESLEIEEQITALAAVVQELEDSLR